MTEEPINAAIDAFDDVLRSASRLFIGYSGGLDSTVLLHSIQRRYPDRVQALHVNHGLHHLAEQAEAHCREFCDTQGIDFTATRLNLAGAGALPDAVGAAAMADGQGVEAAARAARYAWFEQTLTPGDLLLLAHHQDDQAETLLLRLLRGAGPDGLGGMPVRRSLGQAELLRPFLSLPRSALEVYAQAAGLGAFIDPSNSSLGPDRNYLRHAVLPLLEARWPGYRKTFGRAAVQLRAAQERAALANVPTIHSRVGDPGLTLESLPAAPEAAALALRAWLRERGLLMPPARRLQEFLRQLRDGKGAQLRTAQWTLERYRDAIFCYSSLLAEPPREVPLQRSADTLATAEGYKCVWGMLGAVTVFGLDAECDAPARPGGERFLLRSREPGDRLAVARGHSKALKEVFQTLAVPPWWRSRVPLLVHRGAGGDRLLAVGPYAGATPNVQLHWEPPLIAVK